MSSPNTIPADRNAKSSAPMPSPIQKPTKPFPFLAWYLRNGVINASEPELERAELSCERWTWGCGAFVVLGLAFEVALATANQPYGSPWEHWGSVGADVLVTLGVAGEIIFSSLGFVRARRLQHLANERAEKAEHETEKLRAATNWRRLSQEQHETLALALQASGPGASVKFCVLINDHESMNFAQTLSIPFMAAGWKIGYQFNAYRHGVMTGILIPEPHDNWLDEIRLVNARVRDAFSEANIQFANGWPLEPYMSTDSVGLPVPIALVYVGPKPAPPL